MTTVMQLTEISFGILLRDFLGAFSFPLISSLSSSTCLARVVTLDSKFSIVLAVVIVLPLKVSGYVYISRILIQQTTATKYNSN